MKQEGVCGIVVGLLQREDSSDGITDLLSKCCLAWAKDGRRLVGSCQQVTHVGVEIHTNNGMRRPTWGCQIEGKRIAITDQRHSKLQAAQDTNTASTQTRSGRGHERSECDMLGVLPIRRTDGEDGEKTDVPLQLAAFGLTLALVCSKGSLGRSSCELTVPP